LGSLQVCNGRFFKGRKGFIVYRIMGRYKTFRSIEKLIAPHKMEGLNRIIRDITPNIVKPQLVGGLWRS
jgi:hypothetical protein